MFVSKNNVLSFKEYFFKKLSGIYPEREVAQLFELLFFRYKGWSKIELRCNLETSLSESELLQLRGYTHRLVKYEPIQHIFNKAEFYGLDFYVDKNVLIPRQETEELVHLILKENTIDKQVLDIGTGSGCIAVSLAKFGQFKNVFGVDVSPSALKVAAQNSNNNKVKVNWIEKDILVSNTDDLPKVDFIVSNPPYITEREMAEMHANVLDYDPHIALFVENNAPFIFYERIAQIAQSLLKENGILFFEINEHFGKETQKLIRDIGFSNVELIKDLNGKDRMIRAVF